MNALHILLAVLAVVLTVTGPDGLCLVTWGSLAALAGWRMFVAYHGEAQPDRATHVAQEEVMPHV